MNELNKISVSLCLPAFNEEENIVRAINSAMPVLNRISDDWEIVVINDGSSDMTLNIVESKFALDKRIRVIKHLKNRGYGGALISGFYNAKKDWVWLSAADNQFSPEEIFKLLPFALDYDAIVGYREKRSDPVYRRCYARMYNSLIQLMLSLKIKDINCGFKLIKRDVFDKIKLHSLGALIDAEFFYSLKRHHFLLKEVAVEHKPREFGSQTGGNLMVVIRMFIELLKLRIGIKR